MKLEVIFVTILSIILAVPLTAMAQDDGHGHRAGDVLRKQQEAWMAEGEAGVNVVGNNRPDFQYDQDGVHHNVEFDNRKSSMEKHKKVIQANDPNAVNQFYLIK